MASSPAQPPLPPSAVLPPLARLSTYSTSQIECALTHLRLIYFTKPEPKHVALPAPAKSLPRHLIHDTSAPDSGYASAEEDDDDDDEYADNVTTANSSRSCGEEEGDDKADVQEDEDSEAFDMDVLRSDVFEREFSIRWLTAFAARSDAWVYITDDSRVATAEDGNEEEEEEARAKLVDDAASLLASFAGEDDEEEALVRRFLFPLHPRDGDEDEDENEDVEVILNDAPLLSEDHTSVGLQSWGSSILLAERMCASPSSFGLNPSRDTQPLRILELGAGTGLLSIAAAKILSRLSPSSSSSSSSSSSPAEIVASDYHPQVLENLESNVDTNFPSAHLPPVTVLPLDWQNPVYTKAPLDEPFDVILAADVIYHPEHARWIKSCVQTLLRRPGGGNGHEGGVFWMIIPVRSTGRHEGMASTVEAVFPSASAVASQARAHHEGDAAEMQLAILEVQCIGKHNGVGRADENEYRLFKIGWVR